MINVFETLFVGIGTELRSFCSLTSLKYRIKVGKIAAEVREKKYYHLLSTQS